MTPRGQSADASFYYHEDAAADVAAMDTSAVYGNLADAMKDSVVLFPDAWSPTPQVVTPSLEGDDITDGRASQRDSD